MSSAAPNEFRSKLRETLPPALFLAVGIFALFHPTLLSGFALIQTDPGDTRFCNYILEHCHQWISGNPLHANLWNCPFFFPLVNTAAYSDILLGSSPLYSIWRMSGFLPDTSFQLWMIVVTSLNYLCFFILLRRGVGLSVIASIAGAYLFSFAGMRATQLNFQQLLPQFFSIPVLFCLCRMFDSGSEVRESKPWSNAVWIMTAAVCVIGQVLAGIYLGFFLIFGLATVFLVSMCFSDSRLMVIGFLKNNLIAVIMAIVLTAPFLGWVGYHYGLARSVLGGRTWAETALMVPTPLSWIDMGPWSHVYGRLREYLDFSAIIPNEPVHRIGLGFFTMLSAIIGLRELFKTTWGKVTATCTLALVLTALVYPGGWTPWRVVFAYFPGADAIRVVSRISLLILIGISIGVAFYFQKIQSKPWAVALLLLICAEQSQTTMAYDKYAVRNRVEKIAESIPKSCRSFYCVQGRPPFGEQNWTHAQLDAMWAETAANIPTVNGFSGNIPPGWGPLSDQVFVSSQWDLMRSRINVFQWADLNGLPVESVCVVPVLHGHLAGSKPDLDKVEVVPGTTDANTFLGPGWGEDERDGDRTWTWAVSKKVGIFVPLLQGVPYKMALTGVPMDWDNHEQNVSIWLNETPLSSLKLSRTLSTYEIPLRKESVRDLNKVELHFDYSISPLDLGKADDARKLAFALFKVSFTAEPIDAEIQNSSK